jgi:hypothetical protein
MTSIEERVGRLESQLRRWKALCIVLLFCVGGRLLLAADEKKDPQNIVAKSFKIENGEGDAIFSVHPSKGGCEMTIGGSKYGRIEMYPDIDGGRIRIIGKENAMRVQIIGDDTGGVMGLCDAKGDLVVNLPAAKKP